MNIQHEKRRWAARRPAFTLVEMLVVLAIVVALAALAASAVAQLMGSQQQANSRNLVQKLYTGLDSQWRCAIDDARKEYPDALPQDILQGVNWIAGGDPRRARIIWIKLRLMQEFPMTFTEALNPCPGTQSIQTLGAPNNFTMPYKKAYYDVLSQPGITLPTGTNQESIACLYLALRQTRRGEKFDIDNGLSPAEVRDTSPAVPGLKQFVDSWGTPLAFFRWPSASTYDDLGAKPTTSGYQDPEDPEGLLSVATWVSSSSGQWFYTNIHPVQANVTYKLVPVIVSAGADKTLDLGAFMAPGASGKANDNIYSYKLNLGGK